MTKIYKLKATNTLKAKFLKWRYREYQGYRNHQSPLQTTDQF